MRRNPMMVEAPAASTAAPPLSDRRVTHGGRIALVVVDHGWEVCGRGVGGLTLAETIPTVVIDGLRQV